MTAQGQLPYPDGTQLLVRVPTGAAADAPLRLQTLQATPPAAPAILAPLLQGEAAQLQASLANAEPPPGLAELAELNQALTPDPTVPETAPESAPAASAAGAQAAPDPAAVEAAVDALPPSLLAALKTVLELPPSAAQATVATTLETWLGAPAPSGPRQAPASDPLARFQAAVERHPELPAPQAEGLVQWFKPLAEGAATARPASQGSAASGQVQQQAPSERAGAPAEAPATWEAWIKAGIKVLNDPTVSPQGAAFHAAQAKEGTAFYELPLPWSPQHPLQMWVESDRDPRQPKSSTPETRRVLLGMSFTNLGETRVGIAKGPAGLQVRVWAEHPEPLEASKRQVESELEDLGERVDLKIMALTPGPGGGIPSLRSQVTGATLEAMG